MAQRAGSGLGYAILKAQRFLQTDRIFVGIIVIGLIGLGTNQLLRWVHRRALGAPPAHPVRPPGA